MRVEAVKIYQLEELSKEAKERAIEWYRNVINEDFSIESEMITEDFQYELQKLYYPSDNVEWSLSYSQGDGVAFYGHINKDDLYKIVERNRKSLSDSHYELYEKIYNDGLYIEADIVRNSFGYHYSHYNTMCVELDGDCIDTITEMLFDDEEKLNEMYNEEINDYNDEFYELYREVEDLIDSIEEIISQEIKVISKELESKGYEYIEYYTSDDRITEEIIANDYEFTASGEVW